jgi:hypothetical protein
MPAKPPDQPTTPAEDPTIESEQTAHTPINPFDLEIGPPFALAQGCELIERDDATGMPGTYAAIRCDCGAAWRANLLSDDDKACPGCGAAFTHIFVIGPVKERGMLAAIMDEVLRAHDLLPEDQDDDDDQDDDQDDEEEEEFDAAGADVTDGRTDNDDPR